MMKQVVTVVQRVVPHYRAPFFDRLRLELAHRGIELHLVAGQASPQERAKADTVVLDWAVTIANRYVPLGKRHLVWQPARALVRGSDLVVVEHASRLLLNYVLLGEQVFGGTRVAFWGHGSASQVSASPLGEALKRRISMRAHWWFAYNDLSAARVRSLGYPENRITSVNNAVDTAQMAALADGLTEEDLVRSRRELGVRTRNVGIYVGGLYPEKRVPFLIDVSNRIRAAVPDFELIVMGGGPDQGVVQAAARERSWIHWTGPVFGDQKVAYAKLGRVLLMPGLVGLAVLDSFALAVPMVTTDLPNHGPEVAYLESGRNGLIVRAADDAAAYARAVVALLRDDNQRALLVEGCRQDAGRYTIEAMARRFAEGASTALATPRRA